MSYSIVRIEIVVRLNVKLLTISWKTETLINAYGC